MKAIAIIPARSGSKGLKDKNIKMLCGRPLLAYTIEAAKASGCFDEIMVSTDSKAYAQIAKDWGASVPFLRSPALATDTVSTWDAVKEVLAFYKDQGRDFDAVALLQPTSPLRTAADIQAGFALMNEKNANAIIGVCEMDHSPLWANTLPEDGSLNGFIRPEVAKAPRQSLAPYYRINGALYLLKTAHLLQAEALYEDRGFALIMDKTHSVDIDDQLDFTIAEAILKSFTEGQQP